MRAKVLVTVQRTNRSPGDKAGALNKEVKKMILIFFFLVVTK